MVDASIAEERPKGDNLASYYYSHKSFFLRALIWICEHFSRPSGRWMAFFYFFLGAFMGAMGLLTGLRVI